MLDLPYASRRTLWYPRFVSTALVAGLALARGAGAEVLITEVVPNVTTTATRGDVVELHNTGPGDVDLTDWVLSDLDPDPIGGVPQDATFAPGSLGVGPLGPGEFAVIEFVDVAGTASWQPTNYGLRIVAPLDAGSFLGSERDELLLFDDAATPIDFVAWADGGTTVPADSREDLSAVTGVVSDYGLTPGDAAWDGIETIASDADHYATAVDFTAFAAVSTWGGGAIRRISTDGVFHVGAPDGVAQWQAVPRHEARLGNPSDDVATLDGLRPLRVTEDLADWLGQIETTTFPDRRIARFADQDPPDFDPVDAFDKADWEGVLALAMAGEWDAAFAAAVPLGYEVVEVLDSVTGETFHLLRERFVPGEVGFTGQGAFVFFEGAGVRSNLVIEVPHPIFDGESLEEGARALTTVRPRILAVAGTHRNNHLDESTCDGTFDGGDAFRISDVAHHPDNLLHTTHVWIEANLAEMRTVQLHGFCCPGQAPYEAVSDDVILSNGYEAVPGVNDFGRIWAERIDAQGFLADGVDLTTSALFGEDVDVLGGTTNLQGRVTNGVLVGAECNTEATGASGRFHHIEQDPDVREEPDHVLAALAEALDEIDSPGSPCGPTPAAGCRTALKSALLLLDRDGPFGDRLVWKWVKGAATAPEDFSDALLGDAAYQVCVYDGSPEPQPLLDAGTVAGGVCAGAPCWKALGARGFGYKDKIGTSDGLQLLKLLGGDAGKAKVLVKGRGAGLGMPSLPLTLPVVVQLVVDDGGTPTCWESTFASAPSKNEPGKFKATEKE